MNTVSEMKTVLSIKGSVEVGQAGKVLDDNMTDVFGLGSPGFVELRSRGEAMFGIAVRGGESTMSRTIVCTGARQEPSHAVTG